ncbi:MAG: DUF1631 domain-containing protein [Pseudomonadota bacterium]
MPALSENLASVRREAADTLRTHLNTLCSEADDKFFDLSQNAPSEEQSLYFDAMKELRVQRAALVEGVLSGLEGDFSVLAAAPAAAKKGMSISMDSLSLLGDDELDVSVAMQGMIAQARDAVGAGLEHLQQRFAKALGRELDIERLPLHPARICEHFRVAAEKITLPLKARLILFKFFERTVLEGLHDLVAQANQTLARAGVLPEIKSAKPRAVPSADTGRGRSSPANRKKLVRHDDDDEGGDAVGAAMSELLAFARRMAGGGGMALPGPGMAGGGVPAGDLPVIPLSQLPAGQLPVMHGGQMMAGGALVRSDVPVQVIAPAELTDLLTRLQQLQPVAPGRIIEHADPVDVKSGLSELMQGEGGGEAVQPRALNGADDDVISLVSMLFDFILDDGELPSEMKALIGRLQIPLLKVALIDKEFFADDAHPARALVNSLARAGVGWTRDSDDGLYAKIEEVVFAVLSDFLDDLALFERLGDSFAAFVAEREKRMALIEARLRDREEGQAKNDEAQREVRQVIATRLTGRALPPEAIAVVQDGWQRVLYMTAIREGTDSDTWKQRVKVLDVLVWCVQKHDTEEAQRRQRELSPRLVVSLRNGLAAAGFDTVRGEALLSSLQAVLQKLLAGSEAATLKVRAEVVPPETKAAGAVTEAVQVLRRTDSEVVIAAAPAPVAQEAVHADPRWRDMADNLAPGAWIEFSDADFKVRGKIAARIKAQNKYIFVNGRGVKISEKTVDQLALDFESGVARLVSDAALFDRALETMISRLRDGSAA